MKLIDFGSASKIPADNSPYTTFQGTEIYDLPPEFFNKRSYSALPAMTWSIGCLAYVLLNGVAPFATKQEIVEHQDIEFVNSALDQSSRQFLRDVMKSDEADRMTPYQLATHPWLG